MMTSENTQPLQLTKAQALAILGGDEGVLNHLCKRFPGGFTLLGGGVLSVKDEGTYELVDGSPDQIRLAHGAQQSTL